MEILRNRCSEKFSRSQLDATMLFARMEGSLDFRFVVIFSDCFHPFMKFKIVSYKKLWKRPGTKNLLQ